MLMLNICSVNAVSFQDASADLHNISFSADRSLKNLA